MKQIGFKNFRKFADFPTIELAPITMFVGENNAGKSTVVKGILALSDFLSERRSLDVELAFRNFDERNPETIRRNTIELLRNCKFYFNTSYLAHIGTFKRALYNKAEDSVITFKTNLGDIDVDIEVAGNRNDEESVVGTVSKVHLYIRNFCIALDFDLGNDKANIVFHTQNINCHTVFTTNRRYENIVKDYFNSLDKEYSITTCISDNWRPFRYDFIGSLIDSVEASINATIHPTSDISDDESFANLRGRYYKAFPIKGVDVETVDFLKHVNMLLSRYEPDSERRVLREEFSLPYVRGLAARMMDIEYLYAHAVTQTVIYSAKDTNDYLSRTIHEFASQQSHKYKRDFITKWMKEFGIGQNFSIKSVGGEAHLVYIINNDGEKVNLADKGMGSIQLMVLLFRLAITLPKTERRRAISRFGFGKIIIIEEPEQNLHPTLQSKLADLFYELHLNYGFRFIIETHSEYLIRRSQVIVGENYSSQESLNSNNPFKVYYFPSDGVPYDMVYTPSGLFENKFGDGFINEAGKWHMAVLKNANKQK